MPRLSKGLLFLGLLSCAAQVNAIRMVPITAEVSSANDPVEQNFRVDNSSGSPAAVEITARRRSTTLEGKEIREPAEDQLVVFPEQMVLMPGESQLIRVQWLGKGPVAQELAYRVIAEELPVDFKAKQSAGSGGPKISLLMRYEGMLYIQPEKGKANVELVSSKVINHEGVPHLELILINNGNVHVIMGEPSVKVEHERRDVRIAEAESQLKVNMLAGEKRRFLLPWPDGLDPDGLNVQFHYEPAD